MAKLIDLLTKTDERGSLTVIENVLPFAIKRVFHLYNIKEGQKRGGHGHFKTQMALVAHGGTVDILVANKNGEEIFTLESPTQALLLNPDDWHELSNFSKQCSVMVLASENYDSKDYFYDRP